MCGQVQHTTEQFVLFQAWHFSKANYNDGQWQVITRSSVHERPRSAVSEKFLETLSRTEECGQHPERRVPLRLESNRGRKKTTAPQFWCCVFPKLKVYNCRFQAAWPWKVVKPNVQGRQWGCFTSLFLVLALFDCFYLCEGKRCVFVCVRGPYMSLFGSCFGGTDKLQKQI